MAKTFKSPSGITVEYDTYEESAQVIRFGEPWGRWEQHSELFAGTPRENTPGVLAGALHLLEMDEDSLFGVLPDDFTDEMGEDLADAVTSQIAQQFAERIRLFVNACAGIPSDVLEMPEFADVMAHVREMLVPKPDSAEVIAAVATLERFRQRRVNVESRADDAPDSESESVHRQEMIAQEEAGREEQDAQMQAKMHAAVRQVTEEYHRPRTTTVQDAMAGKSGRLTDGDRDSNDSNAARDPWMPEGI